MSTQDEYTIDGVNVIGLCSTIDPADGPVPSKLDEKAVFLKGFGWDPRQIVVVRFLDGDSNLHKFVETHAKEWESPTGLTFKFHGPNENVSSDIRVAFTPAFGVASNRFDSRVGIQARSIAQNLPTVRLGFLPNVLDNPALREDGKRLIRHEFGHAIGLMHEHMSPNARIQFNEAALMQRLGWTQAEVQANITGHIPPEQAVATEFDPDSVMLYMFDSTVANPPTKNNVEISEQDKQLVREMYKVVGGGRVEGTELTIGTPSDKQFYIAGAPRFFRFHVETKSSFVMQTISDDRDWSMALMQRDEEIAKDETMSGPGGNARIRRDLDPGDYVLKVSSLDPNQGGLFQVEVKPA